MISFIIPAYNEEAIVEQTIRALQDAVTESWPPTAFYFVFQ